MKQYILYSFVLVATGSSYVSQPTDFKEVVYSSPLGKRKKITLPDQSVIILNSHSKIRYTDAKKGQRDIFLDGDAYLDIRNYQNKKMIIHTAQLLITTKAARLKVNAYSSVSGEEADVLSGNVTAKKNYRSTLDSSTYILKAGEMVMINKGIDLIEKEKFDSIPVKTWLTGKLVLARINPYELSKKMEEWYNIELDAQGKIPSGLQYTGTFLNPDIQTVLKAIGEKWKFKYRIAGQKVLLSF